MAKILTLENIKLPSERLSFDELFEITRNKFPKIGRRDFLKYFLAIFGATYTLGTGEILSKELDSWENHSFPDEQLILLGLEKKIIMEVGWFLDYCYLETPEDNANILRNSFQRENMLGQFGKIEWVDNELELNKFFAALNIVHTRNATPILALNTAIEPHGLHPLDPRCIDETIQQTIEFLRLLSEQGQFASILRLFFEINDGNFIYGPNNKLHSAAHQYAYKHFMQEIAKVIENYRELGYDWRLAFSPSFRLPFKDYYIPELFHEVGGDIYSTYPGTIDEWINKPTDFRSWVDFCVRYWAGDLSSEQLLIQPIQILRQLTNFQLPVYIYEINKFRDSNIKDSIEWLRHAILVLFSLWVNGVNFFTLNLIDEAKAGKSTEKNWTTLILQGAEDLGETVVDINDRVAKEQ